MPTTKKPVAPAKPAAKSAVTKPAAAKEVPAKKAKDLKIVYASDGSVVLPKDYEPTDTEEFMNPLMKEYFHQRLQNWKNDILRESNETLHSLQEEGNMQKPDLTDRASEETDRAIEFRTRDRERKLLSKIDEAIGRIEDGSYGFCEETGDPIPVKRLIAYPRATMTVEAQEIHERRERTQRDVYE